jgi:hypothetical protein
MNFFNSIIAVASLTFIVLLSATMASTYAQNDTQSSANQTYMTNVTGMNTTAAGSGEPLEDLEGEISKRRGG